MKEEYRPDLRAHVFTDNTNRVRSIQHSQEYWESPTGGGLATAIAYLKEFAGEYEIAGGQLDRLASKVEFLEPRKQAGEYRLCEEKRQFDAAIFGFYQTYLNVPVWLAGLKVTVKLAPNRVVRSEDTSQRGIDATMPSEDVINRYRDIFGAANSRSLLLQAARTHANLTVAAQPQTGEEDAEAPEDRDNAGLLRDLLTFKSKSEADNARLRLIRGRFWIYRYRADERLDDHVIDRPQPIGEQEETPPPKGRASRGGSEMHGYAEPPPFNIPDVPAAITEGRYYMVAEITFEVRAAGHLQVWRILVELKTGAILYLRAMSDNVNGLVYERDPITQSGTTAPDSDSNNATLNPFRNDVLLHNLNAPSGGTQALIGSFANVTQVEGGNIAPPTQATGVDFDYDVRTNNFASVSGYFHVDRIFRTMEDLGFVVATYMSNTTFPVPVDIRCFDVINAHCVGNGMGGIGHVGYGLMDTTDTTNPLGRACDPRVHLHEVLGHGILYEAVDGPNFNFAHSAGDSLSLIYFDPDSACKGVDGTAVGKPGDLRFTYVPWHPSLNRRCDRAVGSGWAWNGSQDVGGYPSEEILATTLFQFYRSIGGDHPDAGRRRFASRAAMYLIIRAIGNLTPATNPSYARDLAQELMTADALNWTSEGVFGGAYHKVIRWAFERQGEYQSPLITNGGPGDGTITTAGKPPLVDVYIDDGRAGQYPFQHVHWHTTTIWNRRAADGLLTHEEPELGATNYAYVKIKNRGTQQAVNVVVRGYHTKPGAGLNWPADFDPLTTASINAGTLNANNSEEKIVGPFAWTPNLNTYGHDCMLMVVSADGDASNVDNFTAGETIPEWRLVPNDNNIGQRNVYPVAGGGGERGLLASLHGKSFFVGNPNPKRGRFTFRVTLPAVLAGWRLELVGVDAGFVLKSGEKREVFMHLHAGDDFTRDAVAAAADRDLMIEVLADDNLIGGMTYRLDPDIVAPFNDGVPGKGGDCLAEARRLADCLGIKQDIGRVCVKEVVVSLKVGKDDCC
jgi:zinc metalloprotease ZmpB